MKSETRIRLLAGAAVVLGLVILLQSTLWAFQMQSRIVQSLGGSISGEWAIALSYEGPAAALRILGGVLLGVGLYRVVERPARD